MSQRVVSESVSDEDTATAAEAVVVRHESIPNKGQTRTGKKLTTISSAFQKPFACIEWTGKKVRPLYPSIQKAKGIHCSFSFLFPGTQTRFDFLTGEFSQFLTGFVD